MFNGKTVTAVLVAAGSSTRMGFDKLLYEIEGVPVVLMAARALAQSGAVDDMVVVGGDNLPRLRRIFDGFPLPVTFVAGAASRSGSAAAGVRAAGGDLVAIHDAARPFVDAGVVLRTLSAAAQTGAAAPAVPVKDTVKRAPGGLGTAVAETPSRKELFLVQTPQVFSRAAYMAALEKYANEEFTDDCALLERAGATVLLAEGAYTNLKLTTPEDIPPRGRLPRVGHGYDVHRLVPGRPLILGGVNIPFELGLDGHSDADVLAHALCDALLGAARLGDIGRLFPDSDPAYKGISSMVLLEQVGQRLAEKGWAVGNIDATVLCQRPRLAPYEGEMEIAMARALGVPPETVSVKATTEEGLGFTGEGLGIAAHAVALLYEK